MSACNRLDLQALGSQPVMPKTLPDHCSPITVSEILLILWERIFGNLFQLLEQQQLTSNSGPLPWMDEHLE